MKEAAGEANMTVVTIVLIAIVLGVGTVIVNNLMKNSTQKANCSDAGGMWIDNTCKYGCKSTGTSGSYSCTGECTKNNDDTYTCYKSNS